MSERFPFAGPPGRSRLLAPRFSRGGFALLIAAASTAPLACGGPSREPAAAHAERGDAATEARARPAPLRIVVTLVVDQLAAWLVDERLPLLRQAGGFRRLAREGTYVRDVRYAHATTDTAPGHAALYTGAVPRENGIAGNFTLDDAKEKLLPLVVDPTTKVVTVSGPKDRPGSSPARLRVPTVADALRAAEPRAVIVSLSGKDRGALFGGGKQPTATLWFDPNENGFVTSTAVGERIPPWARERAANAIQRAVRQEPWLADVAFLKAHDAGPDDAPGEGNLAGYGIVFPHELARSSKPAEAFRASPYADVAVLRLAQEALPLASGNTPMLLALSLSGNDYVGHIFGPDSWEAWDNLLRLDMALASFFQLLDERFGPEGWAAVLAADHGVIATPEAAERPGARPWCGAGKADEWERPCTRGVRIDPDALTQTMERAAESALGPGPWLRSVADAAVYLSKKAEELPGPRAEKLKTTLLGVLEKQPGIARVIDVRELPGSCPPLEDESIGALVCRSIPTGSGIAYYLVTKPGAFFDTLYVPGAGTSHGTPYLYDRSVPLFARAPGRIAAGQVVREPLPFSTYARTAAALLGIAPPAGAAPGADLTARRP